VLVLLQFREGTAFFRTYAPPWSTITPKEDSKWDLAGKTNATNRVSHMRHTCIINVTLLLCVVWNCAECVAITQRRTANARTRPVTSLGHQEGRRVFREGPTFFELCPIFLNYVQHIFPGGAKIFLGGFAPPAPPLVGACQELFWRSKFRNFFLKVPFTSFLHSTVIKCMSATATRWKNYEQKVFLTAIKQSYILQMPVSNQV